MGSNRDVRDRVNKNLLFCEKLKTVCPSFEFKDANNSIPDIALVIRYIINVKIKDSIILLTVELSFLTIIESMMKLEIKPGIKKNKIFIVSIVISISR